MGRTAKRLRFTEEQIIVVLREQEAGAKSADVCRKHGISNVLQAYARPLSKRFLIWPIVRFSVSGLRGFPSPRSRSAQPAPHRGIGLASRTTRAIKSASKFSNIVGVSAYTGIRSLK